MLTDTALRALKPQKKPYKITDRDGMYVHVVFMPVLEPV